MCRAAQRVRTGHVATWTGAGASIGALAAGAAVDWPVVAEYWAGDQPYALAGALAGPLSRSVPLGVLAGLAAGVVVAAWSEEGPACRGWPIRLSIAAGTLAVVLGVLASAAPLLRPVGRGPNVLLVVMDTARRDRLSLHGYGRETTPGLEALARSSTVFENAYSTSSWTAPAHASLFTGLYPGRHGVTQAAWSMPSGLVTLAELFWEGGWRTAGIVGNPMVGAHFGFDQGFESWRETWREPPPDGTHPALADLEEFLDARGERPFFAFLNFIEPHSPYTSSGAWRDAWVRHPEIELADNQWRAYYVGDRAFAPEELEHLGDLYDAEIRNLDEILARVVAALEARSLLDDTVLVITSDHGENLGEHGMVDHVFSLYEPTVRIPLLVRWPAAFQPGARIDAPVQIVDVFRTLLELGGLSGGEGRGLDLAAGGIPPDRPILLSYDYPRQALHALGDRAHDPRLDVYRRRLWALRRGNEKLILGDDGHVELYDVAADPGELVDLAPGGGERLEAMRSELQALIDGGVSSPASEAGEALDPETQEAMRALGYAE